MIRCILGTRPEALKVLPILRELTARRIAFEVIHTGQHTDLLEGTGLRPTKTLNLPSDNDPIAYAEKVKEAVLHLPTKGVKWVVVQGDTASAWGACWGAVKQGLPVCHVEAGLRSFDKNDPWPEENFRVSIDQLATLRCCPTEGNRRNLVHECVSDDNPCSCCDNTHVTGNTIVDQLQAMKVTRTPGNHVLVTLHRREAFGEPLKAILQGLSDVARAYPDTPFLWPVHPNPHVKEALDTTTLPVNVLTRPPLAYKGFIELLASAKAVLTDSGGVVEEACTLGVPTVIARDHTERPEALGKTALLAGKTAEGVAAYLGEAGALGQWGLNVQPDPAFGDGLASRHIGDLLTVS